MAYKVVWSPEALDDVESIAEYIAKDSEYYAGSVVGKIIELSKILGEFPFVGRIVPETKNDNSTF